MKSAKPYLHTLYVLFAILFSRCIGSVFANAGESSSRLTKFIPTHYFIFGDKFSGVNYLSQILNTSSPSLPLQECKSIAIIDGKTNNHDKNKNKSSMSATSLSWRHGFFTFTDLKKRLDCDIDKTLFILTVRDVRSMICSVAKRKFQSTNVNKLQQMHVNGLIIHKWAEEDNKLDLNGSASLSRYKVYNYLRMRTNKLKLHYSILSRVKHRVISRYEDFHKDPISEMKNILRGRGIRSGLNLNNNLNNNMHIKHDTETSCFRLFTPTLYSKAIKKLDLRIERKVGYPLVINKALGRPQNLSLRVWNLLMDVLWWIIIPTLTLLLISYAYLLWMGISRHYSTSFKRTSKKQI